MPAITIPDWAYDNLILKTEYDPERLYEFRAPVNLKVKEHYDVTKFTGGVLTGRVQVLRIRVETNTDTLPPNAIEMMGYPGTAEEFEDWYESEYRRWRTRYVILFKYRKTEELDDYELVQNL